MEKENSAVEKVETISKSKGEKETNKPTEKQQADKRVKVAKAKKEKQKAKEKAKLETKKQKEKALQEGLGMDKLNNRQKD